MKPCNESGGTHYAGTYQHWDFVDELDLGYFEGQITKYVTRHRRKNGREDLEKALHFALKLRELAWNNGRTPRHKWVTVGRLDAYQAANKLSEQDCWVIWLATRWKTAGDLDGLVEDLEELITEAYPRHVDLPI